MDLGSIGKFLITFGIFLLFGGGVLLVFSKLGVFTGKLPGDIFIQKGNFSFFFPIATCIIASIVLTLIVNIVFRIFR